MAARDEMEDLMGENTQPVGAGVTLLPVKTDGSTWPVVVVGMGDSMRPREKAAPDGRLTFTSGVILRVGNKDGTLRSDKSASVHVIEQPAGGVLELGKLYRAEGAVWVQPYEANTRVALSITVERLVVMV